MIRRRRTSIRYGYTSTGTGFRHITPDSTGNRAQRRAAAKAGQPTCQGCPVCEPPPQVD